MKPEIVSRYLARLYIREPRTAPALMRLGAELVEKTGWDDAQPSLVNDLDVATSQMSQGVMLTSADQTWITKVTSESFDVQVSDGYNPASRTYLHAPKFGEFLERAKRVFDAVMPLLATKPHRLAVVQTVILPRPSGGADALNATRARLLNFPDVGGRPAFEWTWRGAWKVERKFGDCSEQTNTIATVRLSDVNHIQPLGDRLIVEQDINTDPTKVVPRFDMPAISAFVSDSESWHAQLAEAVASHAGIES